MSCFIGLKASFLEICPIIVGGWSKYPCSLLGPATGVYTTYLELRVGPPGYFHHHVQDLFVIITIQRYVMPDRNG